jgi:predicted enzyme related to lactoylglutathione lyase
MPNPSVPLPLGLRTVIYHVPDLARAKNWYGAVFGVTPYFDEPFYVGFNVGGFELGLDPDCSQQGPGAGGATAYWGVANADEAVARFAYAGAGIRHPVQEVGGGIRVATVADPFGNVIGLIENPHFASDAVK